MEGRRPGKGAVRGVKASTQTGTTPAASGVCGGQLGPRLGALRDSELSSQPLTPAARRDLGWSAGLRSGLIQWTVYTRENTGRDAGRGIPEGAKRKKDLHSPNFFLRAIFISHESCESLFLVLLYNKLTEKAGSFCFSFRLPL